MATAPSRPRRDLAESHRKVRHPLQKLRGYIRSYISIEGLTTLLIFVAMWFWVGLLLDYESFNLLQVDWAQSVPAFFRALVLGSLFANLALIGLSMSLDAGGKKRSAWMKATLVGWVVVAIGILMGAVVRFFVSAYLGGPENLVSIFLLLLTGIILAAGAIILQTGAMGELRKKVGIWYWLLLIAGIQLYLFIWLVTGALVDIGLIGAAIVALLILVLLFGPVLLLILKRLLVDFHDDALALVLERRYPKQLGDRLITAVELANAHEYSKYGYSVPMIEKTIHDAGERVEPLPVQQVFDWGRLVKLGVWVAVLVVGIYLMTGVGFCVTESAKTQQVSTAGFGQLNDAIGIWVDRNLLLQKTLWPRKAYLEVVGFPESGEIRIPQNTQPDNIMVRAYKWVVADKNSYHGWRPLRLGDLTPQLLGKDVPTIRLPSEWAQPGVEGSQMYVDDIELLLGPDTDTHLTIDPDVKKELRDLLEQLEVQAGRSDMNRKLRALEVPKKVRSFYSGNDTYGEGEAGVSSGNRYTLRFPVLKETVRFWVRGEDFSTTDLKITTVPPPSLYDLSRDEYQPAYLHYRLRPGEDPVKFLKGKRQVFRNYPVSLRGSETSRIDVPAGTDLVLNGTADKLLKRVAIRWRDGSMQIKTEPELVGVDADGYSPKFRIRFDNCRPTGDRAPGKPPVYDFDLAFTDTDNVTSVRNIVIKPNEDTSPTAKLEIADVRQSAKGHYLITPKAFVPFAVELEDNQGLDKSNYYYTLEALDAKRDEEGGRALLFLTGISGDPTKVLTAAALASLVGKKTDSKAPVVPPRTWPMIKFDAELNERSVFVPIAEIDQRLNETLDETAQRQNDDFFKAVKNADAKAVQERLKEIKNRLGFEPPRRELVKKFAMKYQDDDTPFDLLKMNDDRLRKAETPGAQQRFLMQVWVEVYDNDIETGPNRGRSKDTFTFHVIPEEDLRLEIAREEEALRIRMEEVKDRLRGPASAEEKMSEVLGKLADPRMTPEGFGPAIARAAEIRGIVEKCLDETGKVHFDYSRILRELELNRCQESKIENVEKKIVKPIGQLLKGFEGGMPKKEVGFPATTKALIQWSQAMDAAMKDYAKNTTPENSQKLVAQARKDAQEARDALKALADEVEAITKEMVNVIGFEEILKSARKILEEVNAQRMAFNRWKIWLEGKILEGLEDPKKPQ